VTGVAVVDVKVMLVMALVAGGDNYTDDGCDSLHREGLVENEMPPTLFPFLKIAENIFAASSKHPKSIQSTL
jgi:hypothetical protein